MESGSIAKAKNAVLSPSRILRARFLREVGKAHLPEAPHAFERIEAQTIASLPEPAQRYARFMGVVGKPRDFSFRAHWTGGFRLRPDEDFLPCEAWQYNTRLSIARIFHMRLRAAGIIPMIGRDTYVHGHGRLLVRAFDAIRVVDESGFKFDIGELVTYLNDAILFAPSMLLGPETTWTPVDASSFDVTLRDRDHSVTGRVYVDEHGAVTDFSTTDRFTTDPAKPKDGMVRMRWSTPIREWTTMSGRRVPAGGEAVWHLPNGDDFAYIALRLAQIDHNIEP
jgi:hypothetical protein